MAGQQWFRMYAEFATDPKVQMMSETSQRRFTMFLCLHCSGQLETLSRDHVAFALRITRDELDATVDEFVTNGLIDPETLIPKAWDKRQYKSDSSAERTRRYREKKRRGDVTDRHGDDDPTRHSDALDTDTETEQKKKKELTSLVPKSRTSDSKPSRGSRTVPESWQPKAKTEADLIGQYPALNVAEQLARMRLHEYPKPIRDFDRAFRRWCAKAEEFRQRDGAQAVSGSAVRKPHAIPEDDGKW